MLPAVVLAFELALAVLSEPAPPGHLPWWSRFLLALPGGVALVWRHDHPWPVFAIALVQTLVVSVAQPGSQLVFVLFAALYAVARNRDLRASVIAGALTTIPWAVDAFADFAPASQQASLNARLTGFGLFLAFTIGTVAMARNQQRSQTLYDLRSRTTETAIAMRVQSERLAIARELHDRVAGSLAAVTEGIEEAQDRIRVTSPEASATLDDTHATATEAMDQITSVLTVLEAPAPSLEPAEGYGSLDDLLAELQSTGWDETVVDVTHIGATVPLRPDVEQVAVRCVLEGIDNAARYGIEQVQVEVDWRQEPLLIEIVNTKGQLLYDADPPARGGAGLGSIIQLVTGVGGTVRLESTRAAFRLELLLPV